MTVTLDTLIAQGAYINGHNVDVYHDGKHKRVGYIAPGSNEFSLTLEGEQFVAAVLTVELEETPAPAPAPVRVPAKKAAAKKVAVVEPEPEADPEPAQTSLDLAEDE